MYVTIHGVLTHSTCGKARKLRTSLIWMQKAVGYRPQAWSPIARWGMNTRQQILWSTLMVRGDAASASKLGRRKSKNETRS